MREQEGGETDRARLGRRGGKREKTDCVEEGRSIGQSPACWAVAGRTGSEEADFIF